jgi:protease I
VTLVGSEAGKTYPSNLGYSAKSDKAAKDVSAADFDILVIPGGYAPDHLRRCEPMIRLAGTMMEQAKIVRRVREARETVPVTFPRPAVLLGEPAGGGG